MASKKHTLFSNLTVASVLLATSSVQLLANGMAPAAAPASTASSCGSWNSGVAASKSYSGLSFGIQGGIAMSSVESKFNVSPPLPAAIGKNTITLRAPLVGIHVNWGHQFPNNAYLGFEALANFFKAKSTSRGEGVLETAKRQNAFGIAPKFGYNVNGTLLYLRLGIETTKFSHSMYSTITRDRRTSSKSMVGFVPGIGLSQLISDHFVAGLEGTIGFYKKSRLNNFIPDVGTTSNQTYKHQTFDITLRLSYKM